MKKVFTIDDVEYAVIMPSASIRQKSQIEHSRVFGQLLQEDGVLTRSELDQLMKDRKIWNSKNRDKYLEIQKVIAEALVTLDNGGIKLHEAKDLALQVVDNRAKLTQLIAEYSQYDEMTADAQAEEAAMHYLTSQCIVNNETGDKIYKSYEDYLEHKNDAIAITGYINMLELEYGSAADIIKQRPENQFLMEYGFVNNDLQFIDKDGNLVDRQGSLVSTDKVAAEDRKPFLDEDGNPIIKTT